MPWSRQQITAAHIAKTQIRWQDPQYRLVLQNVAGIRKEGGKISSKNTSADDRGFERFMAFAEKSGFVDTHYGPGYWSKKAAAQTQRIHHRIEELADRARRHKLVGDDALAGFVERMTQTRPPEQGGPTRDVRDCDWEYSYKILEGLKGWVFGLARRANITLGA